MRKSTKPGRTNDHVVPQMYLRRFGRETSNGPVVTAARVSDLSASWTTGIRRLAAEEGFYWGTDPDGVPHHHMEQFLGLIERNAAAGFRRLLDSGTKPTDDALPKRWPPTVETRTQVAWWIAAQILRTTRQRARLLAASGDVGSIGLAGFEPANHHLRYIADLVAPLAAKLYDRPWGIGMSGACLVTSDVPVLILSGQDHEDQLAAAEYWDVYLPLDPHRCLYLPGLAHRHRSGIRTDHRFRLHGGLGLALNQAIFDAAVKHVFCHPDHNTLAHLQGEGRLQWPMTADPAQAPGYTLSYELLPPTHGVERKWLTAHSTHAAPPAADDDADPREIFEEMLRQLDGDAAGFDRFLGLRRSTAP